MIAAPTILTKPKVQAAHDLIKRMAAGMRSPRIRSLREFATQEIIVPNGPMQGSRYRPDHHPAHGLFLDAVDSGDWGRWCCTAPAQDGKTFLVQIALAHTIFELKETVIVGLPDASMRNDKWTADLLPIIAASRYRDLLPTTGAGARGGVGESITFKNGVVLRFMTAGGGDKSRAAFTSRNLFLTETDGMDTSGAGSKEANAIKQMIARLRVFGSRRRIFEECTVSDDMGHIWQRLTKNSTNSRVVIPCPHCHQYVTPEREHLTGYQDAASIKDAQRDGGVACPGCGTAWTEAQRFDAIKLSRLIHHGQPMRTTQSASCASLSGLSRQKRPPWPSPMLKAASLKKE